MSSISVNLKLLIKNLFKEKAVLLEVFVALSSAVELRQTKGNVIFYSGAALLTATVF